MNSRSSLIGEAYSGGNFARPRFLGAHGQIDAKISRLRKKARLSIF
jgi:hypothetical protein